MNKYVILATDANPDYRFLAPVTCLCWKRLGYQPVVLDVAGGQENATDSLSRYAEVFSFKVLPVARLAGYRTCNVAQVSRLFAAADSYFSDSDYLLSADMDMLPISRAWFNQQDWKKVMHIFDAEQMNYQRHGIAYVGMSKLDWQKTIGIRLGVSLDEHLTEFFRAELSKDASWEEGWNIDELFLFKKLLQSDSYPAEAQMIERGANRLGLRNGRVDRAAWRRTLDHYLDSRIIDVHLPRQCHREQLWADICRVLQKTVSKNEIETLNQYRTKYINEYFSASNK